MFYCVLLYLLALPEPDSQSGTFLKGSGFPSISIHIYKKISVKVAFRAKLFAKLWLSVTLALLSLLPEPNSNQTCVLRLASASQQKHQLQSQTSLSTNIM